MAHFKELTVGHPVLMGRATWESLPPRFRPLPGRRNLVLTRDPGYRAEGAEVVTALPTGFDGWVIGGAQIYALALPLVEAVARSPRSTSTCRFAVATPSRRCSTAPGR